MNSRSEIFRAPAGNRKFELSTAAQQPCNAWIINRREYEQLRGNVKRFQSEYPAATQWQVMLAEREFKTSILIQRIEDRRCFLDGSETGASGDKFYLEMDGESSLRWQKEFDSYYLKLSKELRETLAMLMSEKIDLQISGSISSLSAMFAKDDRQREQLEQEVSKRLDDEPKEQ